MRLPELTGSITAAQVRQTAEAILEWQLPDGMIPWVPDGHADVWNHTEAAMALAVCGHRNEAARAFEWLAAMQRDDGAWHQYYLPDRVEQDKLDANCCAYVATGVWHHFRTFDDRGFLEVMWPVVSAAIDFVLELQTPRGEIIWARHADGTPWSFALLTGSSSMCHSLRSAIAIAEELGEERPDWELSAALLADVVANQPDAFAPKHRWAMDWYYPVLTGVVSGEAGRTRLAERHETFVMDGLGVRCVSDRPWVTVAETCEYAMALEGVGEVELARTMFEWAQRLRTDDGRYWTGMVYPQADSFPVDERSSYTAAAVILATDALSRTSPAAGLFVDHDFLPALIELGGADDDRDRAPLDAP